MTSTADARTDTDHQIATADENIAAWRELHKGSAYFNGHRRYQERFHDLGIAEITRYVNPGPSDTLLEVGCGYGRLLWHFRDRVERLIGVDLAAEPIEEARALLDGHDATLHVGDGMSLAPVPDQTADVVVAFTVFQHMAREVVRSNIDDVARVLAPGGRFVAQFKGGDGEDNISPEVREQAASYRVSQVAGLAEAAGLQVMSIERERLDKTYPRHNISWLWLVAHKPQG